MRAVFSFPVAVGSILAWLVHQKAEAGVGDPDIWWHLENARLLLTTHHLPRFDTFSYTTLGHPWMDHEWLSEVAYYLAWRALGLTGVYLLFIVLLEIILLGIFYRCYKSSANPRGVWGSFLVSVFCVFLAAVSFGPRTLLFGWVWLIILLLVLDRFRARGEAPLWVFPLVFCLWVNLHGSWLIGMVVFGMIIASGLVEGNWGRVYAVRWSPRQLRQLLATLGASVAALFVNPFGYHLVFYPFDLAFRQKLTVNNIEEWASVDFHTARGKVVMVMLVGILLGALLSRYRWELGQLGLALLAVYAGATYVRLLFLTAILVAPLLASFLSFLPAYRPALDKPWLNAVVMAVRRRRPRGTLIHSDQGTQYGSDAWRRFCRSSHLEPSMSRKGNCWDSGRILFQQLDWDNGSRGKSVGGSGEDRLRPDFEEYDFQHSAREERYITTASHPEDRTIVLVISWTDRSTERASVTRIISARPATPRTGRPSRWR